MAQRTVALCDGKFIGIESIYTVIDGKQINIPDKLEQLRAKSRNNELFCPCGCGANLVLVAGERNLREQHFRIKEGFDGICQMPVEGINSIDSKIALKCWLEDKLHTDDIESRVPIRTVSESERKYEFTFMSAKKKVALSFCNEYRNLSDDKFTILEQHSNGNSIIYVASGDKSETNGQYPEGLMKIQKRQGYCLLLNVDGADYSKAELTVVYYEKNADGVWEKVNIARDKLSKFDISDSSQIMYHKQYYKPTTVTANTYSWGDRIRTIIGKNYPCILGLTSHPRYGEHWVVVTGYNFTSHNSGTYTVNDGWGNVGININSSYTDGGVDIG